MEFLEYANKTLTNIFPKENFEMLVEDVFDIISTNICRSLGPLGSSATILDGLAQPEATKDGYSILDKYRFRNDYKRMIYNLIKAPCTKMNNTVGDGTTTAIALANALFTRYKNRKGVLETLHRLPRQFTKAWDEVIDELQKRVLDQAKPIEPHDYDTIYNIAYVTSNGNREISKSIAEVYQNSDAPFISQKDSPTNKSYIEVVEGFNFPANLISDAFVRNQDMTAEEDNIAVMVFNFKLETDFFQKVIIPINEVYRAKGTKLLIIAPMFDALMCDTLLDQYITMERRTHGYINLILAQFSHSALKHQQLLDLSIILRTKVINEVVGNRIMEYFTNEPADLVVERSSMVPEDELYGIIGCAEHALLSVSAGSLFRVKDLSDDDKYQDTLMSAKNALSDVMKHTDTERQSYSAKVYEARERILQLEMRNYIYYIGADSQLQKNIIWDSINDVIKCVRSAVKSGTVPGCQLTIINECKKMIDDIIHQGTYDSINTEDALKLEIINIIRSACIDVYSKVLHGPDGTGMVKLLPRWDVTTEEGQQRLAEEAVEKCMGIIHESILRNQVFDLETLDYNPDIITSAETDQMVLIAASELVKILISGNQCIIINPAVDTSHEEKKDIYA